MDRRGNECEADANSRTLKPPDRLKALGFGDLLIVSKPLIDFPSRSAGVGVRARDTGGPGYKQQVTIPIPGSVATPGRRFPSCRLQSASITKEEYASLDTNKLLSTGQAHRILG